jgi:DNA-binding NtrC family response regulator
MSSLKTTRISKPQPRRPYDRTSYVLVVDDDDSLLKFFKIHLNKFFSRVIVVETAKDALAQLKEKEIDLVLTDIRMPKVDGLELMSKVRRFDPTIPVLVVSGALLDEEQERACVEEADGFLRKPFSFDDLHDFIDRGMKLREAFKEMAAIMRDPKNFRSLLQGKISPRRAAKTSMGKALEEKLNDHLTQVSERAG